MATDPARPPDAPRPRPPATGELDRRPYDLGIRAMSAGAALLALLGLSGWIFDLEALRRLRAEYTTMMPLTAVGLLAVSAALLLLRRPATGRAARWAGRGLASAGAALGAITIVEYIFGVDTGLDRLLFRAAIEAAPEFASGRSAPASAMAFLLDGAALLLLDSPGRAGRRMAQLFALVGTFIAMQALVAYAYHVPGLLGPPPYPAVALHSALAFALLSVGILLARPETGFMRVIAANDIGGYVARRLLPAAVLLPFILGLLRLAGEQAGVFDPVRGLALVMTVSIAILAAIVWWNAAVLHRLDAERAAAARERARALESRARLIRGFSHDVKNPLGAADGQLALIENGVLDEVSLAQREAVSRARRSIGSALRLIDSLVDLGRVEKGMAVETRTLHPGEFVREIAEEHRAAAVAARIGLEVEAPPGLPAVRSDPDRARQILGNLLSNALKYTPPEGRIEIVVSERPAREGGRGAPWIAIDVSDTGPGIPPDRLAEIFGEFTRLKPGARGGAGLGLAISRRIARLLGGDVTVRSELGRGSTFTLWLPVEPAVPSRRPQPPRPR